jgi:hypothetical protein
VMPVQVPGEEWKGPPSPIDEFKAISR